MRSPRAEVVRLIDAANVVRRGAAASAAVVATAAAAEEALDARFAVTRKLAVYGTLAPGRQNHHVLAPLGGRWEAGIVEGDLISVGWGAALGFPALRVRAGGARVPVQVLTADSLAEAWPRIDAFEGPEYCRVLVPVWTVTEGPDTELQAVANLYAVRGDETGP